jgi:hypothetical protein
MMSFKIPAVIQLLFRALQRLLLLARLQTFQKNCSLGCILASTSDFGTIYVEKYRKRKTKKGDEAGHCRCPMNAQILDFKLALASITWLDVVLMLTVYMAVVNRGNTAPNTQRMTELAAITDAA